MGRLKKFIPLICSFLHIGNSVCYYSWQTVFWICGKLYLPEWIGVCSSSVKGGCDRSEVQNCQSCHINGKTVRAAETPHFSKYVLFWMKQNKHPLSRKANMFPVGGKSLERLGGGCRWKHPGDQEMAIADIFLYPIYWARRQVAVIEQLYVEYSSEHHLSLLINLEGLLV